MGTMPEEIARHTNTEREVISIECCRVEAFAGQLLLVIHDDPSPLRPDGQKAPMLLDAGTVEWLRANLPAPAIGDTIRARLGEEAIEYRLTVIDGGGLRAERVED